MHELGIVLEVAKTLDEVAEQQHITKIGSVTLEIGEVSGILLDYFTDCWNYFRERHPILKEAELKIETIPAVTYCDDCGRTYATVQYGKICPYCGSEHTFLAQGNECRIRQIEAETAGGSDTEKE
jgi:hydrogenase nickel incorporation protein HypA/HybF